MSKLKNGGINVVVAGTDAALNLLKVSDPEGHYVDIEKMVNIDKCIEFLAKKKMDFDLCFVFVHNDAGVSYLTTIQSISKAKLFAIIFGNDADFLSEQIEFKCENLIARTVHNPLPLKKKIDDRIEVVKRWAVSN